MEVIVANRISVKPGEQHGNRMAIREVDPRVWKDGSRVRMIEVECVECGDVTEQQIYNWKAGKQCLHPVRVGQRFGNRTVLALAEPDTYTSPTGEVSQRTQVLARCDCGAPPATVVLAILKYAKSSGCSVCRVKYQIEIGDRFGRWTVTAVHRAECKLEVLCDCGTDATRDLHSVVDGRSSSCGCWNREVHGKYPIGPDGKRIRPPLTTEQRIAHSLRNRMLELIRSGKAARYETAMELVGCTWSDLVAQFESQFGVGMTWDNRGEWEIDHIRPLSSFDLLDPEQVRAASHHTNLQPLWRTDNRRKSAHWDPTV